MPILSWLTRDDDIRAVSRVPYRLLEEVPALSAGDPATRNMLIQGDNLDALKSLLPFYAGQVKCIYIDPPFNTGQAFEHYDDNLEHAVWLSMMYARLECLHELLSLDGTITIHMDSEELAYLIVLLDEIFGRKNRVNICTFIQGAAVGHKAINPGMVTTSNYVVIYARDKANGWEVNRVFTKRDRDVRYSSYIANIEDDYPNWRLIPLSQAFAQQFGETPREQKKRLANEYEVQLEKFVLTRSDRVIQPVPPAYDAVGQKTKLMIDESKQSPNRVFLQIREGYSDIYICNGKR